MPDSVDMRVVEYIVTSVSFGYSRMYSNYVCGTVKVKRVSKYLLSSFLPSF